MVTPDRRLARWISIGYPGIVSKVLISIPDELLRHIDREVEARRTTRSHFLQEAAERELGWGSSRETDEAIARARSALKGIGQFESADLIRRDRDLRSGSGH
jgi:hypothetical protein